MDPIAYLKAVRRRWKVVAVTIVAALATGFLTTSLTPPAPATQSWFATTTLLQTGSGNLATMAALAEIGEVPERVAKKIGYKDDPLDLAARVEVSADPETGLLNVIANSSDRQEVVLLSEAFATELVAFLTEQNALTLVQEEEALRQQVQRLRQEAAEIDQRIAEAPKGERASLIAERDAKLSQADLLAESTDSLATSVPISAGLRVVQEPTARPLVAFQPPQSIIVRLAIAGVIGLFAGVAIALILERVDTRIRTRQAAEEHFGLPVLSEIPVFPRGSEDGVISIIEPQSPAADAFRLLGAAMTQPGADTGNGDVGAADGGSARTIMVTSSGPGEGKSTVVANLAATLAEVGNRVLVLSCDFRRPSVHRMLGVSGSRGLADGEGSDGGRVLERRIYRTSIPGVRLVPSMSRPKKASELFASGDLQRAVDEARETADIVILDTAPLLASGEVPLLIPEADAVVVVARARRTKAELAERTGEILKRFDAPVTGVVLMGAEVTLPQGYYRYQRDAS